MAFAMRVFDQHEAACRNMANLAVTGLVLYRTIKPDRKHRAQAPCAMQLLASLPGYG